MTDGSSGDEAAFESAFTATTYLLGRRGDLTEGLSRPGAAARRMAALLAAPERAERARRLSEELARMAAALATRSMA